MEPLVTSVSFLSENRQIKEGHTSTGSVQKIMAITSRSFHSETSGPMQSHASVSAKQTVQFLIDLLVCFLYCGDKRDQGKKVRHQHSKVTSHLNNSLSLHQISKGAKDKPKLLILTSQHLVHVRNKHQSPCNYWRPQDPAQRPCHDDVCTCDSTARRGIEEARTHRPLPSGSSSGVSIPLLHSPT